MNLNRTLGAAAATLLLSVSACDAIDKEIQYRVAAKELAADMRAMSAANDVSVLPAISPDSAAHGEAGQFARTFKAFLIRIVGDRKGYKAEMDALHFPEATAPGAVGTTAGLQHARDVISQARAVTIKYKTLNEQRLAAIRRDMTAIAPDSKVIQGFQRGFDEGMGRDGGPIAHVFTDELKIFDEFDKLLVELQQSPGHWRIVGGNFAFNRTADMDRFNAHMRAIQDLAADEQAVVTADTARQAQAANKMDPTGQ